MFKTANPALQSSDTWDEVMVDEVMVDEVMVDEVMVYKCIYPFS